MSTFSELDQRYYPKGQTYSRDEINAIALGVAGSNLGPATTSTNPGALPQGKSYTFNSAGTYTNFKDVTNTAITIPAPPAGQAIVNGIFYCNGTYWLASYNLITPPTVDVSGKEDVTNKSTTFTAPDDTHYPTALAVSKILQRMKQYNLFYSANYTDGFFTGDVATTTIALTTPPGTMPFPFINKAFGITSSVSGKSSYAIKSLIPVVSTDRWVYGAWFNTTQTFAQSGIASIGWYHQTTTGTTASFPMLWTSAQLIAGATKVSGVYTSTCVAVVGDWAYISVNNTADTAAGTTSISLLAYATGTATAAAYSLYIANLTMLMGESSLHPYVYYDNSAYGFDTGTNAKVSHATLLTEMGQKQGASKYLNLLNDYNNFFTKWLIGSGTSATISNAIGPGIQPYPLIKNVLQVNGISAHSAYVNANIPVISTDRYIYGAWFNKALWSTITGIGTIGFSTQSVTNVGGIVSTGICLIGSATMVAGKTLTAGIHTLTVEAVSGDWVYISCKNNSDNGATTAYTSVNPFVTGTGTSAPYSIYWANFTFLKGVQTIDPWMVYDNTAFPITSLVSPLNGKKLYVEGDSIMQQGLVTGNIVSRTGAILTNTAVAGNTWAVNASGTGSMVPRLSAITPSNADVIMIACGTNDWGKNSTFGSFASRSNTSEFYSSVYNGLLTLRTNNPQTPILLVLPSQRYYQGTGPDGTNRPNTNVQGKTLLDYVNAMKEIAALLSIKVADQYSEMGFTYENLGLYTADGLHANATGAQLAGAYLTNKLNALSFI